MEAAYLGLPEALKERVECPDCGRQMSAHTLRFTYRCPAKKEPAPSPPTVFALISPGWLEL